MATRSYRATWEACFANWLTYLRTKAKKPRPALEDDIVTAIAWADNVMRTVKKLTKKGAKASVH